MAIAKCPRCGEYVGYDETALFLKKGLIKGGKLALGGAAAIAGGAVGGMFGPTGANIGQQVGGQVWDALRKDKSENNIRCSECGYVFAP